MDTIGIRLFVKWGGGFCENSASGAYSKSECVFACQNSGDFLMLVIFELQSLEVILLANGQYQRSKRQNIIITSCFNLLTNLNSVTSEHLFFYYNIFKAFNFLTNIALNSFDICIVKGVN